MVAFDPAVEVFQDAQVDSGGEGVDPLFEIGIIVDKGIVGTWRKAAGSGPAP